MLGVKSLKCMLRAWETIEKEIGTACVWNSMSEQEGTESG